MPRSVFGRSALACLEILPLESHGFMENIWPNPLAAVAGIRQLAALPGSCEDSSFGTGWWIFDYGKL